MRLFAWLASAFVTLCLAACGGGGASSDGQGTSPVLAPPAASPTPAALLQTSVPVANYITTSAEAAAYRILNQERLQCGVGALAQNAGLDAAAAGQAQYQVLRQLEGRFGGHDQVPGTRGYVAVTPAERAKLAGYPGLAVGENSAMPYPIRPTPSPAKV